MPISLFSSSVIFFAARARLGLLADRADLPASRFLSIKELSYVAIDRCPVRNVVVCARSG